MLVSHQERPRELKWYHAGPLLYGDWGTSRFYVLGLAFYYALYSSFWYILGVGLLVTAVGWAYTVVCRVYPDGGGVYSAARQVSPTLSVIGALLLFADYAVTAALSAFEGAHYWGIHSAGAVQLTAIGVIILLGLINYIGSKKAGTFALFVAMATLALTLVLVFFAIPHLSTGWANMRPMEGAASHRWITLVNVVLALSGVEAVANMTGIMVKPVNKTSKKSIWPVLVEVVGFNILLGIAMLAVPTILQQQSGNPNEFQQPSAVYDQTRAQFVAENPGYLKDPALKAQYESLPEKTPDEKRMQTVVVRVMGEVFIGPWFGVISGAVFGLLLFSAVNTVVGGMISVSYVMSRDRELPSFFSKLNLFGVPWAGLIPALGVPCILLLMFRDLDLLADLYAIGVVGAIAINLSCCTINKQLPVKVWERLCIGGLALIMICIELTLAVQKWHALIFVCLILGVGLSARFYTKTYPRIKAARRRRVSLRRGIEPAVVEEEVSTQPRFGTPPDELDMNKPHIMIAARGQQKTVEFAAKYTHNAGGILFVVFVRQWNVPYIAGVPALKLEDDNDALRVFKMAEDACKKFEVPFVPIYVVSPDIAYSILDFAATYNAESLIMGVSRKGAMLRALQGDVITSVADQLPEDISLLIHA